MESKKKVFERNVNIVPPELPKVHHLQKNMTFLFLSEPYHLALNFWIIFFLNDVFLFWKLFVEFGWIEVLSLAKLSVFLCVYVMLITSSVQCSEQMMSEFAGFFCFEDPYWIHLKICDLNLCFSCGQLRFGNDLSHNFVLCSSTSMTDAMKMLPKNFFCPKRQKHLMREKCGKDDKIFFNRRVSEIVGWIHSPVTQFALLPLRPKTHGCSTTCWSIKYMCNVCMQVWTVKKIEIFCTVNSTESSWIMKCCTHVNCRKLEIYVEKPFVTSPLCAEEGQTARASWEKIFWWGRRTEQEKVPQFFPFLCHEGKEMA